MDSDQLSSPPPIDLSLPPSAPSEPDSLPRTLTPQRRPTTDALTLDDAAVDATEQSRARKKKRPRVQNADVPLVKDAVGESVADTFENFLRT
jgi:DNA replication licensing factor MCM6